MRVREWAGAFSDVQVVVVVQTQSMESLLSQLAETAAQERALLEECGDLLSVAASLEVGEEELQRFSELAKAWTCGDVSHSEVVASVVFLSR
jgi:hypothetical protein